MTGDELRALDAEVHTRVMGLECFERDGMWCERSPLSTDFGGEPFVTQIPDYSSDIAAAWRVVERLMALGWLFHVLTMSDGFVVNARGYKLPADGDWPKAVMDGRFVQEVGDTAALAICLAALEAVAGSPAPA